MGIAKGGKGRMMKGMGMAGKGMGGKGMMSAKGKGKGAQEWWNYGGAGGWGNGEWDGGNGEWGENDSSDSDSDSSDSSDSDSDMDDEKKARRKAKKKQQKKDRKDAKEAWGANGNTASKFNDGSDASKDAFNFPKHFSDDDDDELSEIRLNPNAILNELLRKYEKAKPGSSRRKKIRHLLTVEKYWQNLDKEFDKGPLGDGLGSDNRPKKLSEKEKRKMSREERKAWKKKQEKKIAQKQRTNVLIASKAILADMPHPRIDYSRTAISGYLKVKAGTGNDVSKYKTREVSLCGNRMRIANAEDFAKDIYLTPASKIERAIENGPFCFKLYTGTGEVLHFDAINYENLKKFMPCLLEAEKRYRERYPMYFDKPDDKVELFKGAQDGDSEDESDFYSDDSAASERRSRRKSSSRKSRGSRRERDGDRESRYNRAAGLPTPRSSGVPGFRQFASAMPTTTYATVPGFQTMTSGVAPMQQAQTTTYNASYVQPTVTMAAPMSMNLGGVQGMQMQFDDGAMQPGTTRTTTYVNGVAQGTTVTANPRTTALDEAVSQHQHALTSAMGGNGNPNFGTSGISRPIRVGSAVPRSTRGLHGVPTQTNSGHGRLITHSGFGGM